MNTLADTARHAVIHELERLDNAVVLDMRRFEKRAAALDMQYRTAADSDTSWKAHTLQQYQSARDAADYRKALHAVWAQAICHLRYPPGSLVKTETVPNLPTANG